MSDDRIERMRRHQKSLHQAEEKKKSQDQAASSHQIAQDARSASQTGQDTPPVLSMPPRKPQQPQKANIKPKARGFRPPAAHDRQIEHKGRLPDGARYETRYCAVGERWTGTLTVPLADGRTESFSGQASGLFKLIHWLDDQYRLFLRQSSPAKVAPSPPAGETAS